VAYPENVHGGGSCIGIWWSFVFDVRCLWRHNLTSYSCFQTNILAKFVDIIGIFFYTHSPYFMCNCTEYKLPALHVATLEENKLNAMTQQFVIAKISGCVLKQGSKTHSPLRQSNLQRKIRLRWCLVENGQSSIESVRWARWRTLRFARQNLAKLNKYWKYA